LAAFTQCSDRLDELDGKKWAVQVFIARAHSPPAIALLGSQLFEGNEAVGDLHQD
jgi:hypothetical protein